MQLLESPIPPLTAAALRIIICKRPAPHFDNHKCIFETLHTEIKCVLSVKESNFNEKKRSKFSHLLTVGAEVADLPPLYGQPDRRTSSLFLTSRLLLKNIIWDYLSENHLVPHCS